ncbi:MAG: hypothetical protein ACTHQM_05935, partial [Thermoanaerobaculia bacterium]
MPFAAFAANVGKAYSSGNSIEWQLDIRGHSSVRVTIIAPDGTDYVTTVKNGLNPSFNLAKLGSDLQDGVYQYELVVEPNVPKDVQSKLKAARAAGDDAAAKKIMKAAGLEPISQSGAFTVRNGSIVDPNAQEADANDNAVATRNFGVTTNAVRPGNVQTDDQVIPDDLIVQGSACIGLDCVNNESFGFDTIRLKENNTRIKFDDTSTSAGFAASDWQLTANDSASGGANKFSIEDITSSKVPFTITGGATTNSIFVDSTGRVGFRTSTPVLDLHVATSNTPAIRLEQNNSGGFTAQTWDIGANEANFFVRDVTSGSRLPFRIRPGAPTSSIDISASGQVGIGTASPDEQLDVVLSTDANMGVEVGNVNTGVSANAFFRTESDSASVSFQSHGSGRTISRFGKTLASWNEMLATTGNGLILGTLGANDLILGTNSAARLTINGSTGAITVPGNFTVTGVKNFAVVDPSDDSKALYYTALEGPEAGTYFRGTAKTVNGVVEITLPGYFSRLTEQERMTVQITPVGAPGQLYVAQKSPEKIIVKVAEGASDLEFDYLV